MPLPVSIRRTMCFFFFFAVMTAGGVNFDNTLLNYLLSFFLLLQVEFIIYRSEFDVKSYRQNKVCLKHT